MKNKGSLGIFVLAFDRLDHLKKVINALSRYTKKSEIIYIFADNSNNKSLKVNQVHSYIKKLNQKKFKVIIRDDNLGLKENWWRAYDFMFKKYDKVICIEDDILINKNFMTFMRDKLISYQYNKKVMSITGYAFPIKLPKNYKYDIFFSQRSNAWGQASWRRVWTLFKKNKENNLDILLNKNKLSKLSKGGNDIVHMFVQDYLAAINSIQIWWVWNILKNNGLCINPVNSLVANIGFDGTGTHYKNKVKKSSTINISKKNLNSLKPNSIIYNDELSKSFSNFFKISYKQNMIYRLLPMILIIYIYKFKIKLTNFFN
jgi:hypothetical protein